MSQQISTQGALKQKQENKKENLKASTHDKQSSLNIKKSLLKEINAEHEKSLSIIDNLKKENQKLKKQIAIQTFKNITDHAQKDRDDEIQSLMKEMNDLEEQNKQHQQSNESMMQEKQASIGEQDKLQNEIQRLTQLAEDAKKDREGEIQSLKEALKDLEEQNKQYQHSNESMMQEKQASIGEQDKLQKEIQRLKNLADHAQKDRDDEIQSLMKEMNDLEEQNKQHQQSNESMMQEKQASIDEQGKLQNEIQRLTQLAEDAKKDRDDEIQSLKEAMKDLQEQKKQHQHSNESMIQEKQASIDVQDKLQKENQKLKIIIQKHHCEFENIALKEKQKAAALQELMTVMSDLKKELNVQLTQKRQKIKSGKQKGLKEMRIWLKEQKQIISELKQQVSFINSTDSGLRNVSDDTNYEIHRKKISLNSNVGRNKSNKAKQWNTTCSSILTLFMFFGLFFICLLWQQQIFWGAKGTEMIHHTIRSTNDLLLEGKEIMNSFIYDITRDREDDLLVKITEKMTEDIRCDDVGQKSKDNSQNLNSHQQWFKSFQNVALGAVIATATLFIHLMLNS